MSVGGRYMYMKEKRKERGLNGGKVAKEGRPSSRMYKGEVAMADYGMYLKSRRGIRNQSWMMHLETWINGKLW